MKTRNALKIVLVLCTAFSAVGARAQKAAIKTQPAVRHRRLHPQCGSGGGTGPALDPRSVGQLQRLDLSRTTAGGSTGSCSPRHATGSATVSQDISRRTRTRRTIQFRRAPQRHFVPGLRLLAAHRQTLPGWFVGAGVAYGYAWILGRHWNLEAEIGIGYAYTRYDTYPCANCGDKIAEDQSHHYVGPTKAAVNPRIYVLKSENMKTTKLLHTLSCSRSSRRTAPAPRRCSTARCASTMPSSRAPMTNFSSRWRSTRRPAARQRPRRCSSRPASRPES